jgi:hypothetical protein
MRTDIQDLAVNALRCLDIGGRRHSGHELEIIYDGSNQFKKKFAGTIAEEAQRRRVSTTLHDVDELRRLYKKDDEILDALAAEIAFDTGDSMKRNAINMLPPNQTYAGFRGKVTRELLLPQKAYVLQFPFAEKTTAETMLALDPREVEGTALAMKKDLDRATRIRLATGDECALEYAVNPALKWVVSVGLIKKYSPRFRNGRPKGGWGNPPGEIFTSFAHSNSDYLGMNGDVNFNLFTLGSALPEGEYFTTHIVRGAVDIDKFRRANRRTLNQGLINRVAAEFGKERYADHPGELGIGLVRGIDLTKLRDTIILEKVGGTFHTGFGYDENDRGTGGFVTITTHNDCGATGILEAKIDRKWKTVLLPDGSSPYFAAA